MTKDMDKKIKQLKKVYKAYKESDDVGVACYGRLAEKVFEGYPRWFDEETKLNTDVTIIYGTFVNWTAANFANIMFAIFDDADNEELLKVTMNTLMELYKERISHLKGKQQETSDEPQT